MYEKIKERYEKFYITDGQLERYVALSVLTKEQAADIRNGNKMAENGNGGVTPSYLFTLCDGWQVALYAK